MPRGDGTGPNGLGEMTGRSAGYCAGYERPGWVNDGRRFLGRGGRNMGRRFNYGLSYRQARGYSPPAKFETEKEFLENEIQELNKQLSSLNKRMEELAKDE